MNRWCPLKALASLTVLLAIWTHSKVEAATEPVSVSEVDRAVGLPLWTGKRLWNESPDLVARRLGWPLNSSAPGEVTYRLKAGHSALVLGVAPFCLSEQAVHGRIRQLVLVYINQFDPYSYSPGYCPDKVESKFQQAVKEQGSTIALNLTKVLGIGRVCPNPGAGKWPERVTRWDWSGNSILLDVGPGRYVVVTIVPTRSLTSDGRPKPIDIESSPAVETKNVLRRANGDVVVSGIPMVDQGSGDFCGPATWERAFRYCGVPADMFLLGIAGGADWGGKLRLSDLDEAVGNLAANYGRKIECLYPDLSTNFVAKYINAGVPLVWACNTPPSLESEIDHRSEGRRNLTNWALYKKESISFQRHYAQELSPPDDLSVPSAPSGHLRLIMGYNVQSQELAITDSFGPRGQERWITVGEANAVSLNYLRAVR